MNHNMFYEVKVQRHKKDLTRKEKRGKSDNIKVLSVARQ